MSAYVVMLSLGKKINLLRRRAGLSQEGLAAALGVSQNLISAWERDANLPRIPQLVRLGETLNAPLDYLANEADERGVDELAEELDVRRAAAEIGWAEVYSRILANAATRPGYANRPPAIGSGVVPTIESPGGAPARKKA